MKVKPHLIVYRSRKSIWIAGILSWSLLIAGCAQPRYAATPSPVRNSVESVAFTSMADRVDIVDQATSALISSNFSITLANDRIGLVQTDYVSISTVQQALADTLARIPDLDNLLMKVAINAEQRDESVFVQIKGTFQRISGQPRTMDNLVGLYWLEQLADQIAAGVDAQYVHQLDAATYSTLLEDLSTEDSKRNNTGVRGAMKAGGILVVVLFALTLLAGSFGPTASPATSN